MGCSGWATDSVAGKRAHADEDLAHSQAGIAFEVEESGVVFLAECLRFGRKIRRDEDRRSVGGEMICTVA